MPGFSPFPLFGSLIACPPKGGAPGLDHGGNAPESGNFEKWVAGMVRQIPPAGSHGFVPPTEEQLARWRDLFTAFTNRDWPAVSTSLDYFGNYRLIFFSDEATNESYSILAERNPIELGWGTYVQDAQAGNELAIEVDHPDYDVNTWRVGASLFQQADARYLLIAGAHRFANGKGESVESDMARNKKSPFQAAHEAISRPDLLTLSIHGFTRGKYSPAINASDVVLSAAAAEVPPVVTTLKNALEAEGITAGVYDGGADFRELCGKVNPQGRYSNKMYGVGRYVHVEIERAYRQKDTWLPVVSGLGLGLREYFSHQ